MSAKGIGELRDRIRIEQDNGTTFDEIGGAIPGWTALNVGTEDGMIWAKVEPMSQGEQWRRLQMNATANWKITIRYRSDLTTKLRVMFGSRTFEVKGVSNPDMRKRFCELACEEMVAP